MYLMLLRKICRDSLSLNRVAYFIYQESKSGVSEYVNTLSSSEAGKRANIKKKHKTTNQIYISGCLISSAADAYLLRK